MEQITFATYIGQQTIKSDLEVRIAAAKMRNQPLDHFLICGANLMGKVTLVKAIAHEMNTNLKVLDSSISRTNDVAALLTHLRQGDIVLIEDVEKLNKSIIPLFAECVESYSLVIEIGKGASAKTMKLNLPHFTVIGITSYPSQIERQLNSILSLRYDFRPYTIAEMAQLVSRFAVQYDLLIQPEAAKLIARYCEGTPGKAKVLVKRIADYCLVKAPTSVVTLALAKVALSHLGHSENTQTPSELARRLRNMDGIEFEEFTAQFFRARGYSTEMTKVSGDHGIDLFAKKGQELLGIQCKRWTKPVGEPIIRDFYGALMNSRAKKGVVIATAGFTSQAIDFARGKPIGLIDLDRFIELIVAQG